MYTSFLQHTCANCQQSFHSAERLRTHRYTCTFCPKCKQWVEYRHLDTCKGPRIRAPRIVCPLCNRLRSKDGFVRHMKCMHNILNYSMAGKKFESEASNSKISNRPGQVRKLLAQRLIVKKLVLQKVRSRILFPVKLQKLREK